MAAMMLVGLLYLSWRILVTRGSGCFSSRMVTRAMRVRVADELEIVVGENGLHRLIGCDVVHAEGGHTIQGGRARPSGLLVLAMAMPPETFGSKSTLRSA